MEPCCLRGDIREYLHPQEVEILEEQKLEDTKSDLNQKDSLQKETQTDIELKIKCFCDDKVVENKLLMKKDRIICSFKKVNLSEEEWEDIEETVKQSELNEMLVDYSKVMEDYWRLENKDTKGKE